MKIKLFLVFFLGISLFFTGCTFTTDQFSQTVCDVGEQDCANDLILNCSPGLIKLFSHQYTIKKEELGKCIVNFEYIPVEGADNPLVGDKMTCTFPASIKNLTTLDEYIVKNQFQNCKGDLKEELDQQASKVQQVKQDSLDELEASKQRAAQKLQEYEASFQ